jgi:hypothetical protein
LRQILHLPPKPLQHAILNVICDGEDEDESNPGICVDFSFWESKITIHAAEFWK